MTLLQNIKKHFDSINELLKVEDITAAKQDIDHLEELPALGQAVKLCDNPLINVILYQYMSYAQNIGISFNCDIRASKFPFVDATSTTDFFPISYLMPLKPQRSRNESPLISLLLIIILYAIRFPVDSSQFHQEK